jgi:UDP-N-acetylmuramoylalanine--D-glutamate ligase
VTGAGAAWMGRPLVAGFGVTGRAVARSLLDRGFHPVVVDDRPSDDALALARRWELELVPSPGADELAAAVAGATVVLPSPGLPDHHPVFAAARRAGVPLRSEFDLAAAWDDRPLIAITGTNGKTTVTTLVTGALERSGTRAAAVGNTDVPLVAALDDPATEVFVVEASSFRLGHTAHFAPVVATWLNLAPDHLDAHSSLEAYVAAKASIWRDLGPGAVAIANAEDPVVLAHVPDLDGVEVVTFGLAVGDWRIDGGNLAGPGGPLVAVSDLRRRQPHDLANGLAVAATALAAGARRDAVAATLADFEGLEHRVQLVAESGGVRWYDDSKATVPHATMAALGGFDSVVLIAGGRNKGLDLSELAGAAPPIRHVVAIGDAAPELVDAFSGVVPVETARDMSEAVDRAGGAARAGDVVLLSPGCTSFDWYRNYAERGRDFTRLARARARQP